MNVHSPRKHVCNHGSHAHTHAAPAPRVVAPALRGDAPAEKICERMKLQLSAAARRQLSPYVTGDHYFARLLAADLDTDARKFLAAALPVRRALWWSVLAIHDRLRADDSAESDRLAPVVQWIARPSDAGLLTVRKLDVQVKRNSLWGCLYQATYAVSGRVSAPERQMVIAPPEMSRRMISTLIYMASVYRGATGYRERQRQYLLLGQSLAQGPAPWKRRTDTSSLETK